MSKNAQLYRNALRGVVAALALGGFQVAHAGYAQLSPPAGFSTSSGGFTYAAAANDRVYGKVIHQAGALTANVGGQAVKMPAAYRLAANAPRIAAAAIYLHPGVRTAVGIAAWLGASAFIYDQAQGIWKKLTPKEIVFDTDLVFWTSLDGVVNGTPATYHPTFQSACSAAIGKLEAQAVSTSSPTCSYRSKIYQGGVWNGNYSTTVSSIDVNSKRLACPSGTSPTASGCKVVAVEYEQVGKEQFEEGLAKSPMPSTVPQELPYPTPLPVEQPYINPSPGENPQSQPLRVPNGTPTPVPNTNPQQYRQPYIDIVPAPTPSNPWQVDVKPGEVTSTDPNPAEQPNPDGEDKPAEEQDKSLCEKHPDILACQKPDLDTPDGEIPRETKTVTYAEEGGFGGGSCPGNIYSNVGGKSIMVYNWSETCGVVSTYLRPIILLLGAMGALFILIPGRDS